jgi:hypothetical protein
LRDGARARQDRRGYKCDRRRRHVPAHSLAGNVLATTWRLNQI